MVDKKKAVKQFKPPANPREALKRLSADVSALKRQGDFRDTISLSYVNSARKLIKYLEGFVSLTEATPGDKATAIPSVDDKEQEKALGSDQVDVPNETEHRNLPE